MDPVNQRDQAPPDTGSAVSRGLFYLGSAGLLTIMIVETIAVIGRHVRHPLLGALEIVQVAIIPTACAAMVITTLLRAHAVVHLLIDRLSPRARHWTQRIGCLIAGAFFAAVCVGEIWLTHDFWGSFEETDVLHIPLRPLRVLVAASAGLLAAIFLYRAARPERA